MSKTDPHTAAPLSPQFRKTLRARGNRLKAAVHIGRTGPNDHNRQLLAAQFGRADLVKVRVHTDDAAGADRIGQQLAETLSCAVVSRTGKVILLYKTPDPNVAPIVAGKQK